MAPDASPASVVTTLVQLPPTITWIPLDSLFRLTLALGIGLFVGVEREWRGKEAGLRTFGLVALLGGIGGMLGVPFAVASLASTGLLVGFLNLHAMRRATADLELTTSAALLVSAMCGVLCGMGHTVTPAAIGVVSAWLLASKERLAGFSHKLTEAELRSAILLGVLAFAIYPVLPAGPVDHWGLVFPREAWLTVLLIAGIGFVNYLLWKLFGTRGVEFAGFLGGLVNSTVTVTELSSRAAATEGAFDEVAYRGVMLSVVAMAGRNAVILGMLSLPALFACTVPLTLMLLASLGFAFTSRARERARARDRARDLATSEAIAREAAAVPDATALKSPFSLRSALKFGVIFLVLQVVGTLAQAGLGRFGFYGVSVVGGLVSSASAVASAGSLAAGSKVLPSIAGTGAVVASLASAAVNVVIVSRVSRSATLTRRIALATAFVVVLGIGGAFVQARYLALALASTSS